MEEMEERALLRQRLINLEKRLPDLKEDIELLLVEIREIDAEIEKKGLILNSLLLEDPGTKDEVDTYKEYIGRVDCQKTMPESIYKNVASYTRRLIQLLTNPL